MVITAALREARLRLRKTQCAAPLEAEILLGFVLGKPRSYLHAWPEQPLRKTQQTHFWDLVSRRGRGEPIAYLTGSREFWSLDLRVTPATLIPRPETELLVELALAELAVDSQARIADLGTGSGAVALALASERPRAQLVATDRCSQALSIARGNAQRLGLRNVEFRQGNWCQALAQEAFSLILSNPPYIPSLDHHLLQGDLRFEPRTALAAGADGLKELRRIVEQARGHLAPGGKLLLEHGHDQRVAVTSLLNNAGYERPRSHKDLAGRDRVTSAVWKGADQGIEGLLIWARPLG